MENIHGIYYINLDRREDRRAEFLEEARRMEIRVERFPAIEKNPGMLGCHLSHLGVLKKARELGLPNVLVFEDDFQFIVDKETFKTQVQQLFDSGIHYDVVMLSYALEQSEPLNDLVGYARAAPDAAGYLVNKTFYDTIIDHLETNYAMLEKTHSHWLYLNDQCWKSLQKEHTFLYFMTRVGKQRVSFSDLRGYVL